VQAANETLMMGLRLREGLDLVAFVARHGRDLTAERGVEIARLEAEGWVTRRADRLALTTAGMPVAGEITARLALDEEE
jgi:oxygen-independent coproporphyrinogen-3 oxidase